MSPAGCTCSHQFPTNFIWIDPYNCYLPTKSEKSAIAATNVWWSGHQAACSLTPQQAQLLMWCIGMGFCNPMLPFQWCSWYWFYFNGRQHMTTYSSLVDGFMKSKEIRWLYQFARSPDPQSYRAYWDTVGKGIATGNPPPRIDLCLKTAFLNVWDQFLQDLIIYIISIEKSRWEACTSVTGHHIPN